MDKRFVVSIALAAPLAAAGMLSAWWLSRPHELPARPPVTIVEHCRRAAELLYDISWAAACLQTSDDSPECTLPDAQAAKVNAILAAEEARCMGSYTPP
jgi:myo-inositol catabolism protein IolC